jgi:hypothetical protein
MEKSSNRCFRRHAGTPYKREAAIALSCDRTPAFINASS